MNHTGDEKMANKNEDTTVNTEAYNHRLMNNVVRMPMVVGKAVGSQIWDEENDDLLWDYWGDEGVCSLGYNTPEVLGAAMKFFASMEKPHQLPDIYPTKQRWEAAEIICDRTGMDRIFFANSGTEANEGAIKMARKYWWDKEAPFRLLEEQDGQLNTAKRHTVLTVKGNFHGRTAISMAAGDFRVSPYHRHGFGPGAQGFGVLDWDTHLGGQVQFMQAVTDGVEHEEKVPDWSSVAAIILAPVLGNNVVSTYPMAFWIELERIRDEFGVLIIYDDVQAGSGRAGYFATYQSPDIGLKPDIMTLAKGIAMGFPMSCLLASEEMAKTFTPGVHFNTFGGSPFVCHMAVELYKWLDFNIEHVRTKGQMIRDGFGEMDWIVDYDGSGLLNAFTPDFERLGYNGFDFIHQARKQGLSLATHRPLGPIRFTPRLNVPASEISQALVMLDDTNSALIKGDK
jgi:acetylornithine/succinyldiaminopimelate/putrescine aminotransferase